MKVKKSMQIRSQGKTFFLKLLLVLKVPNFSDQRYSWSNLIFNTSYPIKIKTFQFSDLFLFKSKSYVFTFVYIFQFFSELQGRFFLLEKEINSIQEKKRHIFVGEITQPCKKSLKEWWKVNNIQITHSIKMLSIIFLK